MGEFCFGGHAHMTFGVGVTLFQTFKFCCTRALEHTLCLIFIQNNIRQKNKVDGEWCDKMTVRKVKNFKFEIILLCQCNIYISRDFF